MLELILTEACNLACSYCFEYGADRARSMSPETARAAIDFLIDASRDSDWVGIGLMGGEPMLRFDLVREVVEYARRQASAAAKTVSFQMTTNGMLLKEEHLRFFKRAGLQYCLSLDGAQEDHDRYRKTRSGKGSFETVVRKMRLLKRYQHWQGARMTVMPDTAARLRENVKRLHEELAINQFIIGIATHVRWADGRIADYCRGLKEAFEYYLHQRLLRRSQRLRIGLYELGQFDQAYDDAYVAAGGCGWGCGAGSGRIAVQTDGTFHGCSKLAWGPAGSRAAPLPLGSVRSGLSRPENREKLLTHTADVRPRCGACEMAPFCGGGCYAVSFTDTGNIHVPADYYCKLMFAQKAACDYARKRLKELGVPNLLWGSELPDLAQPRQ